eukprot:CCRYP_019645-RA/>CCRYP_019645-RA protein AED:0.02 eAED:0.06 QI:0/0/0.5/1/1/1/2/2912/186
MNPNKNDSIDKSNADDTCCIPFDPSVFYNNKESDYKIIHWDNKPLYVPIRFDKAVIRAIGKINQCQGAALPKEEVMVMSDCASPWYTNVLVSVATEEVKGAAVEKISGDFLAKVFEGDYSNIGKWVKEVELLLPSVRDSLKLDGKRGDKNQGSKSSDDIKHYLYYPTCPKCAKIYGKNHVVILASL